MTTVQSLLSSLVALILALGALPALAHPRDELGQASYLGITASAVTLELSLTPGELLVAPFSALTQKPDYPAWVLSELRLTLDGKPLALAPVQTPITTNAQSTKLFFSAPLASLAGGKHTLRFENRHAPLKSAYLAATLAGAEGIIIGQQTHDATQQTLTVEFQTPDTRQSLAPWMVGAGLLFCAGYGWTRRRSGKTAY